MSFDRKKVIQLLGAIDASPSKEESNQAFEALNAYLGKHGRKFLDILEGGVQETVLDMKQQDSLTRLEGENSALKGKLDLTQGKLEKAELKVRALSSELLSVRAKKFVVTGLIGVFTGAACAAGYFLGNSAWSYASIKSELEDHYAEEESKMKRNWIESKSYYDAKSQKLEQESIKTEAALRAKYQSLTDKTRQETLLDLERAKISLRKGFERELRGAKEDFAEKIAAGQPYKSGEGRYGYIKGRNEYIDVLGARFSDGVIAKVFSGSCVLIKGSSSKSDRLVIEQYIQGRYISGEVYEGHIQVGDVGPTADCVTKNALLTPN